MQTRPQVFRLNRNHPLHKGLVFAGLGGASTLQLTDLSGYGNSGTLSGMDPATDWVWSPELNRFALDFDGSDDQVVLPNITLGTSDFTITAWAYLAYPATSANPAIIGVGDTGAGEWMLRCLSGNGTSARLGFYADSGSIVSDASSGTWYAVRDQWAFVSVRRRGSNLAVQMSYPITLSGATDGSAGADLSSAKGVTIGGADSDAGRWWKGRLTDVLVWKNRTLEVTEVEQLSDPSNVMLSGLLQSRRRLWPVGYVAAAGGDTPLTVDHGAITYTGQAITQQWDRILPVTHSAVTYTGQEIGFARTYVLPVEPGVITYTGQDVSLLANKILPVEHTTVSYVGQEIGLTWNRVLPVDPGVITYTGQTIDLLAGNRLQVSPGTITWTGQDVGFTQTYVLPVTHGTLTWTGQAITLTYVSSTTLQGLRVTAAEIQAASYTSAVIQAASFTDSEIQGGLTS